VLVTDVGSGRSVKVRISDRGPFAKGRIIDLSPAAAERLGIKHDGVAEVSLQPADPGLVACPFETRPA
jgi:rare lipoprotein A